MLIWIRLYVRLNRQLGGEAGIISKNLQGKKLPSSGLLVQIPWQQPCLGSYPGIWPQFLHLKTKALKLYLWHEVLAKIKVINTSKSFEHFKYAINSESFHFLLSLEDVNLTQCAPPGLPRNPVSIWVGHPLLGSKDSPVSPEEELDSCFLRTPQPLQMLVTNIWPSCGSLLSFNCF